MAGVVVQHAVINGVLQVERKPGVLAEVEKHIVFQSDRLGPHSGASGWGRQHDGYVLEQQTVNAGRAHRIVKGVSARWVNEVNLHAGMGHGGDVEATTADTNTAESPYGQRQGSAH